MRLWSKLASWISAGPRPGAVVTPQHTHELGLDPAVAARMPRASAEQFRERLLAAVLRAHQRSEVTLDHLDPSVSVLVIPRGDAPLPEGGRADAARLEVSRAEREQRISHDIDDALRSLEGSGRALSSVTWSALRDARPPFAPAPHEWAGEQTHRFEGDAGLIFFVDLEALALAITTAAEGCGFVARIDDDAMVVRVSDGKFEAHVGVSALLAEALWTGRGPLAVILKRASALPGELRSFLATLRGLERRFPAARFEVRGDHIAVRTADAQLRVDYRYVSAALRKSALSPDAWLGRVLLEDVVEHASEPNVVVRAPAYLKAYPLALHEVVAEGTSKVVRVAVREEAGRMTPVLRVPDEPADRFAFFREEAQRQLPFFRFDGYAFVVEQAGGRRGVARAVCLVGDKAATIATERQLIRGALEQLVPLETRVKVQAFTEGTVCFASVHASDGLLAEARRRAIELETDLLTDGNDAIVIDTEIDVPEVGLGHFELKSVPEAYFSVRDQAVTRSDLGRGHTDYLRGLSYELLGRADLALPAFERAVRTSRADGEMNLALGRTLCTLGEHARAVTFLEKAAGALPEHGEASNALGLALYRIGQTTPAREAFERAVRLAPDEVGFLINLGRSCVDEQMFPEARSALERALTMEPSSAEAHASMAVLLHKTGARGEALAHAREALAEEPEDDTVRELLKMLEEEA